MHERQLLLLPQRLQLGQRRMQAEVAVQVQRARCQADGRAQPQVVVAPTGATTFSPSTAPRSITTTSFFAVGLSVVAAQALRPTGTIRLAPSAIELRKSLRFIVFSALSAA
jgi:hypothetical protein